MISTARRSASTVAGLSFATAATVGHGTIGLVVGLCAIAATTLIAELFWWRAQRGQERTLWRLLGHTASVKDTERLMRLLLSAHRDVLRARQR